jgi:exopolysaccharide biosynthesis WecB/TagA/CpsF family protein
VGTDFIPDLLAALGDLRPRVFLYGAAPGIADRAARVLEGRCPGLRVVGTDHGFGDATVVVARVRAARPDVLLVALGNPLQEAWIADHLRSLDARVAIGVGALFDYLSGNVRRAPTWVRTLRCEWLFRLALEPGRLWRRYVLGNPRFLWRVLRSRVAGERS